MLATLSLDEAMDAVDAYGADSNLWPRAVRDELLELQRSNEEFASYVEDVKRIDEMLANWDEADDGLDVGEDDWDGLDDEDEDDQDEDDDQDSESEDGLLTGAGGKPVDQDDDDEEVIEVNPDRLKDMDEMFSDAIQKAFTEANPTDFRVFTRDYDRIVDIQGVTDSVSIAEIDQAVAKSTGVLQKDLRRMLAARSQVKRVPGMRSGRLHSPNLHRIIAGDDRVFTRRQEAASLDTAISLVIDCSGSMSGGRLKLATESAYALGCVLNRLGIQFECLGFTDDHHNPNTQGSAYYKEVEKADQVAKIIRAIPLIMPKFKTFEERWTQPVQRRFAHVYNKRGGYDSGIDMGTTPEGCGVEFAARRLLARKEARKIMIVMTDGEPGGDIFRPRSTDDHWAYKRQSEEVVKAVEAAGIDLIGIGIQHAGPQRYYTNSMVISDLDEMPSQLMGLLKKFVLGK